MSEAAFGPNYRYLQIQVEQLKIKKVKILKLTWWTILETLEQFGF